MKKYIITFIFLVLGFYLKAQVVRIAIVDFDNISGVSKYDGLGKAMSSMLISDIESNVSNKRFQLVERTQINKIIKEQNLQKSSSFDKNTSVKMGKLLGVDYLLIGDIFILNNSLIINTRLTEVSTGNIKFSEKKVGNLNNWLSLKTLLAKAVSSSLSMPFTEPLIPDGNISSAVLNTYANAVDENDKGNYDKAETLINTAKEFNPEFKYLDDLKDVVEKLKKQIAEQGKKIEVLEKSGGRVINAKSYLELSSNLKNELTNYEEKKNIFVSIINQFPNQIYKNDLLNFIYPYFKKTERMGLNDCTILLQDLLKLRALVKKENHTYFDKSMYFLIANSLNFSYDKVRFNHSFSEAEYHEFTTLKDTIVKNAFEGKAEQLFASFNLLHYFNYEHNKNFKNIAKRDIIENHKKLYEIFNYSHFKNIIEKCLLNGSENIENDNIIFNSAINSSTEVLLFLAGKNPTLKNVISENAISSTNDLFEKSYNFHYKINNQNKDKNVSYINDLNKICLFFGVTLDGISNNYSHNYKLHGDFILEIPQVIVRNELLRKKIISIDSISQRSKRIQKILDKKGIQDPCEISKLQSQLIVQSDSLAISNEVFVLNNEFPIGKTIEISFNNKKETIKAHIIGKKILNTQNKFEIINNDRLKNLDKSNPVLFIIQEDHITRFNDLNLEPKEDFLKEKKIECEKINTAKKVREERSAQRAKQDEIRIQNENQKTNAKIERQKKSIDFFNQNDIYVDSTIYNIINQKINKDELPLDTLFKLGYEILLNKTNFKKDRIRTSNDLSAQLSILFNLNFINRIEQLNLPQIVIKNYVNAATINLAHGYLLCSIIYHANANNLAETEYNKLDQQFKFNEIFENYNRNQMILKDWNEFIEKGIVSKAQLKEFNTKFKILDNF